MALPAENSPRETFDITIRLPMSREQYDLVDALALARECSRPAAVRFLIDIHAGKAVAGEGSEPPAGGLEAPAQFNVIRFAKPRLSRELIAYIAGLVVAGLSLDAALDMSAVTTKQRREWWRRGSNDRVEGRESLYADYVTAIQQAAAQVKLENIETIKRHRSRTFKAAAWLLERGYPDEYGERKRVDANVSHSLVPMIDFDRLSLDEARTLVRLLRKASPEGGERGLGARARPAADLLPPEVVEVVDGEWSELEAPALEGSPDASAEAPALVEKPDR